MRIREFFEAAGLAIPGRGEEIDETNRRNLSLCMDVLLRNKLLEQSYRIDEQSFSHGGPDLAVSYALSDFGMSFVLACRPPS
jgi:hypothetical protein